MGQQELVLLGVLVAVEAQVVQVVQQQADRATQVVAVLVPETTELVVVAELVL